jgi:hypothetical protein
MLYCLPLYLLAAHECALPACLPPTLHWLFPAAAASSGLESASYARADALSNHMGLFLQKTNIIRDYLVRNCWGGGAQL